MLQKTTPPGPKGIPFAGSLFDYFRDILGFLTKSAREYGDIVYFKLGPRKIYLVSDPEYIKDVLVTDNKNFKKSRALQRARMVVGEGLLTNEGESHLSNRRVIQQLFHKKAIPNYVNSVVSHTQKMCSVWHEGTVLDINREMMHLTQSIVVDSLFNTSVEGKSKALVDSLTDIMNSFPRLLFPFSEYLDNLPIPANLKFKHALKTLDDVVYSIIEEKKYSGKEAYDLVSLLIRATNENGERIFNDRQIRDEVITFFIAGQETTANALSWAFWLISLNRKVEENIFKEIRDVLNGDQPAYDDIEKLVYLRNVVSESMRLYPPAWTVVRRAIDDYRVGGYDIPSGSDIYMSQFVVHRDGRIYDDPMKFSPERWFDLDSRNLPRFAYFPFGGGTRRCVGEPFAVMEAVIVLAIVYNNWSLKPAVNREIRPKPLITIRPENGIPVRLEKRDTVVK